MPSVLQKIVQAPSQEAVDLVRAAEDFVRHGADGERSDLLHPGIYTDFQPDPYDGRRPDYVRSSPTEHLTAIVIAKSLGFIALDDGPKSKWLTARVSNPLAYADLLKKGPTVVATTRGKTVGGGMQTERARHDVVAADLYGILTRYQFAKGSGQVYNSIRMLKRLELPLAEGETVHDRDELNAKRRLLKLGKWAAASVFALSAQASLSSISANKAAEKETDSRVAQLTGEINSDWTNMSLGQQALVKRLLEERARNLFDVNWDSPEFIDAHVVAQHIDMDKKELDHIRSRTSRGRWGIVVMLASAAAASIFHGAAGRRNSKPKPKTVPEHEPEVPTGG